MLVIQLDHNTAETLINGNHLFGLTIIAFLTAKRSLTAIETLLSRWSKCSCSYADDTDHGGALAVAVHRIVNGIAPILAKLSGDPKYHKLEDKEKWSNILLDSSWMLSAK
jgi:hypothetical protein